MAVPDNLRGMQIGSPQQESVVAETASRISRHNERLTLLGGAFDQLVGGVPTETSDASKSALSGDFGNLQSTIDHQEVLLSRIEAQMKRLMNG